MIKDLNGHQDFTGPKVGKRVRRKGLSRKEKKRNRRTHRNKYAHLAPQRKGLYDPVDKTFRDLPLHGKPGEVKPKGLRIIFHGRSYALMEDTTIPLLGHIYGHFKIVMFEI